MDCWVDVMLLSCQDVVGCELVGIVTVHEFQKWGCSDLFD